MQETAQNIAKFTDSLCVIMKRMQTLVRGNVPQFHLSVVTTSGCGTGIGVECGASDPVTVSDKRALKLSSRQTPYLFRGKKCMYVNAIEFVWRVFYSNRDEHHISQINDLWKAVRTIEDEKYYYTLAVLSSEPVIKCLPSWE